MKPNESDDTHESEFHDNATEHHDEGRFFDDDDLAARHEALEDARIEDFRHQALQQENPLAAALGASTSRLMEIAKASGRDILEVLANRKAPLHGIPELPGAIQTNLNVNRQVDRFANLFIRLTETKGAKPSHQNRTNNSKQ